MQRSSRWLRLSWSALPGVVGKRPAVFAAGLGVVVVVAVGVAGLCFWPSAENVGELPTARTYRNVDACLLTDGRGVVPGTPAAPVWAGMQDASRVTGVRVSFLPAAGPNTEENVVTYVNSLVQEHCSVVVAVGAVPAQAIRTVALRQKDVHFVAVGDGPSSANVSVVNEGDRAQLRERVRGTVAGLTASS